MADITPTIRLHPFLVAHRRLRVCSKSQAGKTPSYTDNEILALSKLDEPFGVILTLDYTPLRSSCNSVRLAWPRNAASNPQAQRRQVGRGEERKGRNIAGRFPLNLASVNTVWSKRPSPR